MLRVKEKSLPHDVEMKLRDYQAEVNTAGSYEKRVESAKSSFSKRSKSNDPAFKVIRKKLEEMCPGIGRCCYCEDSSADEVEHIGPKDLYPERVFEWKNFLFACGKCNTRKSSKFALIDRNGKLKDITRGRNEPVEEPFADGSPAMINPRRENPMDLIILDLHNTFMFVPHAEKESIDYSRAKYTVECLLQLNRDELSRARCAAFFAFFALLQTCLEEKQNDSSLERHMQSIKDQPHRTVWEEMKRQKNLHAKLRVLFDEVPEALDW